MSAHLHLQWEGPFDLNSALAFQNADVDYGIYQIYGTHPIYGTDVLLYIGKAEQQTFGSRLSQHDWIPHNQDSANVQIYLGRLCGYGNDPSDEDWVRQITIVERLLIFAHCPAGNSSGLNVDIEEAFYDVHVLNWGRYRSLLPEVSAARFSKLYSSYIGYHRYGEASSDELKHAR